MVRRSVKINELEKKRKKATLALLEAPSLKFPAGIEKPRKSLVKIVK
jgi:hypothetical protein